MDKQKVHAPPALPPVHACTTCQPRPPPQTCWTSCPRGPTRSSSSATCPRTLTTSTPCRSGTLGVWPVQAHPWCSHCLSLRFVSADQLQSGAISRPTSTLSLAQAGCPQGALQGCHWHVQRRGAAAGQVFLGQARGVAFGSPWHCSAALSRTRWRHLGPTCDTPLSLLPRQGQYVEFVQDCLCDGPVETWLQHVVDAMKAALAAEFKR